MLFFISEDVANLASNGDKKTIDTLYSLGYFWRIGCCLVDGSRSTLLKLVTIQTLKNDYELIQTQKQSVLGLYKMIDFFVLLQANDGEDDIRIEGATGKSVNINQFENHIKFGLNLLLCENIRDCIFYKWGATHFSNIDGGIFRINTLGYNGGGSVIVESARNISQSGIPCLAICDNDKKYPEGDEGDTSSEFKSFFLAERPLLMWRYELKVHEAENLIPHDLLCKLYGMTGLVKKMKNLKSDVNYGSFFSFFDFKEGFKKSTLRKMRIDRTPSYNSYTAMLLSMGITQKKIDNALAAPYRKDESPLLQGLGRDLLEKVIDFVENNDINFSIITDDHQSEDWNHIIKMVWSIGCANAPRRV